MATTVTAPSKPLELGPAESNPAEYPRGVTLEDVWAAFRETERIQKENALQMRETDRKLQETDRLMRESDRRQQESRRETERLLKESRQETERLLKDAIRTSKRTSKQMGDLHNRFGKLSEHLVTPGIVKRFNELGFHFQGIAGNGCTITDETGEKIRAEIDILLENGEFIIAVEVKSSPAEKDIEHHIKRLKILREVRDKSRDSRKIRGAVAGAIFPPDVKELTLEAGLYVIEQTGYTMKIDVPAGFIPREW